MSEEFDVQAHTVGVSLIYPETALDESLPGQLNLTYDEADELYHQLAEIRLIKLGLESHEVRADATQDGDIIESLGRPIKRIVDPAKAGGKYESMRDYIIFVLGDTQVSLTIPRSDLIRVNRRIQ